MFRQSGWKCHTGEDRYASKLTLLSNISQSSIWKNNSIVGIAKKVKREEQAACKEPYNAKAANKNASAVEFGRFKKATANKVDAVHIKEARS